MWSSSKRKLILSNLSLLELNHKKTDFHGAGSWFWLFRTHPQRMNACRDTANCYEYASRSEQSALTASEAMGRTAVHIDTHVHACSWTHIDASKCAKFAAAATQQWRTQGEGGTLGRLLATSLIIHSIQISVLIHVFFTAIFSRPSECSTPVVLLEDYLAQQSTLAACVHVLLMCVCFLSSWTHTIRCKTLLMIRDFD